ncbi:MAG: hypothetical protein V4819_21500 [Verrucomicrobiota bacterium]
MLPQPPPNAEAPLPSEAALRSHRIWFWIWITGVFSILGLLFVLAPFIIRVDKSSDQTEAVSNARQIGLCLFEFEDEYGAYPDVSTISRVKEKTKTELSLGAKSSNDFFRQLLATGLTQSERMFYSKIGGTRKADDDTTGAEALKKSECGFTYFLGATELSNPGRPLVVTPMIPGTDRFDPKPFKGKAIILRANCSVTSMKIDKDGHVIMDGRNLMDPLHPIWEGNAPVIAWPEL